MKNIFLLLFSFWIPNSLSQWLGKVSVNGLENSLRVERMWNFQRIREKPTGIALFLCYTENSRFYRIYFFTCLIWIQVRACSRCFYLPSHLDDDKLTINLRAFSILKLQAASEINVSCDTQSIHLHHSFLAVCTTTLLIISWLDSFDHWQFFIN